MKKKIALMLLLVLGRLALSAQDLASIYAAKCANCHGRDGRGNTPLGRILKLPDLRSSQIQGMSDADLATIISKGAANGKMPGFRKKLGEETTRQLVTYVHRLNNQAEIPGPAVKNSAASAPRRCQTDLCQKLLALPRH